MLVDVLSFPPYECLRHSTLDPHLVSNYVLSELSHASHLITRTQRVRICVLQRFTPTSYFMEGLLNKKHVFSMGPGMVPLHADFLAAHFCRTIAFGALFWIQFYLQTLLCGTCFSMWNRTRKMFPYTELYTEYVRAYGSVHRICLPIWNCIRNAFPCTEFDLECNSVYEILLNPHSCGEKCILDKSQ